LASNGDWAWLIAAFKAASGSPTFLASIEAVSTSYATPSNSTTGGYSGYGSGASSIDTTGVALY
jgi:hypothetical protein